MNTMIPPIGPVRITSAVKPQVHPMSGRMITVMATNAIHTSPCTNPANALPATLGEMIQK